MFGSAMKTARRVQFIDELMKSLTSKKTFGVLRKGHEEKVIAAHLHPTLRNDPGRILRLMNPSWSDHNVERKSSEALLWERNLNTTINHIQFMGTQHRPDFIVKFDDIRIGVELKRGDTGSAVREALGQCLVYSSEYEFVCCVIADTSKDERIKKAFGSSAKEKELLERLWDEYNIKIAVV